MTTELDSETRRDTEKESGRDVIEVTSEEVDEVAEPEPDSPRGRAELVEGEDAKSEPSVAGQPETGSGGGEPVGPGAPETVYCVRCGRDMRPDDRFCRNCGWDSKYAQAAPPTPPAPRPRAPLPPNTSPKNRLTALLLCVLLGPFGAHRFYLGKIGTGVLWLVTLGFLGLGVVFDVIMIATGECRDSEGKPVLRWD